MNSEFIIRYVFSVNILKNRISLLIYKKELQRFVSWQGWYEKAKLIGLVQKEEFSELLNFRQGSYLKRTVKD